jgi:hypothetical protein
VEELLLFAAGVGLVVATGVGLVVATGRAERLLSLEVTESGLQTLLLLWPVCGERNTMKRWRLGK